MKASTTCRQLLAFSISVSNWRNPPAACTASFPTSGSLQCGQPLLANLICQIDCSTATSNSQSMSANLILPFVPARST